MYVQLIIPKSIDRLFTYHLPDNLINKVTIGDRVLVPFGGGNQVREGYVHSFALDCDYKTKAVRHLVNDSVKLSMDDIDLIEWMRETYLCSYDEAMKVVLPSGTSLERVEKFKVHSHFDNNHLLDLSKAEKVVFDSLDEQFKSLDQLELEYSEATIKKALAKLIAINAIVKDTNFKSVVKDAFETFIKRSVSVDDIEKILEKTPKNYKAQIKLLEFLKTHELFEKSKVIKGLKITNSVVLALKKKGVLEELKEVSFRRPSDYKPVEERDFNQLTDDQRKAFETVDKYIVERDKRTVLLHGVTGSGKTEVYIHLIKKCLSRGQGAILLVPEISLTPQITMRFKEVFGDKVALIHSKLSMGERFDQWKLIKNGDVQVVIGARSAVFAPVLNLSLIIMDEEHEHTYKSEQNPKYLTHEIADFRLKSGVLLLGSATPSIETFYKVQRREVDYLHLKSRFGKQSLPPVTVVDMRKELEMGNKTMFSALLYSAIEERLKRNEQVILFLNRKGYATFVSCRSCGYTLKCPQCDISLTYHKNQNITDCSYCGQKVYMPKVCPDCGSDYFKQFGVGTERVHEYIKKIFPQARVGRMDSVSTSKKGSLEKLIDSFEKQELDILIGTQMVTKGLDFHNVTLVGVIAADTTLNLPDFRASEKTFQLLTQVSGRAGRGDLAGQVIVQTYTPENYAIQKAKSHDFLGFYESEIKEREVFEYPPLKGLYNILISGLDEVQVSTVAERISVGIKRSDVNHEMYGPTPALVKKAKKRYRYQILIKYDHLDYLGVKDIINSECKKNESKGVHISIDGNPRNIL